MRHIQKDGGEVGSVNELLCGRAAGLAVVAGPRLFPMTPEGDVAEIERVPPGIERGGVEAKDAFAGQAGWRRDEGGEAVVNDGALDAVDPGQEMPEREGVAGARFVQQGIECGLASRRIQSGRIKLGESRAESL